MNISPISVHFKHLQIMLPRSILRQYGSPHFDAKWAGRELSDFAEKNVREVSEHIIEFNPDQILCANEAFPEAAISDPLSDLDVWNEWRFGNRVFPYPGRYGRLSIVEQKPKTQSPASVGVLGEIMAGLYAQAGIAPWVLVRVIRRWPDFIFRIKDGEYAFVESKAFTTNLARADDLRHRIRPDLLAECLVASVHQLNADPNVTVWGAFTAIYMPEQSGFQRKCHVTFLELKPGFSAQTQASGTDLPQPVTYGLAERAVRQALNRESSKGLVPYLTSTSRLKTSQRKDAEFRLIHLAEEELRQILSEVEASQATESSHPAILLEIERLLKRGTVGVPDEGRRFFEAKEVASQGGYTVLREVAGRSLVMADLDANQIRTVNRNWTPDYTSAHRPWDRANSLYLWRCGGAIFGLD